MFQNLVGSLERSRAAMAEDLANLSARNETLKNEVDTIPSLKQKLQVHYIYLYSTRQSLKLIATFLYNSQPATQRGHESMMIHVV